MNVIFTRFGLQAGVPQVNPHRFRHTFATWSIRTGARELDVQYLLGHSSSLMVRRYSATYDSEQAAAKSRRLQPGQPALGRPNLAFHLAAGSALQAGPRGFLRRCSCSPFRVASPTPVVTAS